jgi:CubicO group peptidase (beta-lactamase class C family)
MQLMKQEHIPGMFLTIVNKDTVLFSEGLGYSDIAKQKRVNNQTIFRMGSITKTFTAIGIMKLVEKGKLSLNDKLKDITPKIEFQNE